MPEQLVQVAAAEKTVDLLVDLGVGIGGDLWPATTQFTRLLVAHRAFFSSLFDNKRVLELGSGTGLTGLLLCELFKPACCVVSDLHSHLDLMQRNLKLNEPTTCTALELDWCNPPTLDSALTYDVIIALECVYREDLYVPLVDTMRSLLSPRAVVLLGLTRSFSKPLFFRLMRERGLRYTMVPLDSTRGAESSDDNMALFVCTKA